MSNESGFWKRFGEYRPSKVATFWFGVACVFGTALVGFIWGGWVTSTTAQKMAADAATKAQAQLVAAICVNRFESAPDATVQQAALKKVDSWDRGSFIEKGGWTAIPGIKDTISGAADLCASRVADAKLPAMKTAAPAKAASAASTHS